MGQSGTWETTSQTLSKAQARLAARKAEQLAFRRRHNVALPTLVPDCPQFAYYPPPFRFGLSVELFDPRRFVGGSKETVRFCVLSAPSVRACVRASVDMSCRALNEGIG